MEKQTMPKEIKAKWLEALRSGRYKQGSGCLYDKEDDTYCCLGVCQMAVDGQVEGMDQGLPTRKWADEHGITGGRASCATSQWNPVLHVDGSGAAYLNDHNKWTFSQIADAIEEYIEGV